MRNPKAELAAMYGVAAAIHLTAAISAYVWGGWVLMRFAPPCLGSGLAVWWIHRANSTTPPRRPNPPAEQTRETVTTTAEAPPGR
ncbi:hypothetical protein ACIOWG_12190 [Streptomyces sp. NPDC087658]|uniref:hypothetical protein n=1 Tax=Streptomyces sp. NPDC087658 TaxID=3365800 RepID=UPI0037FACE41